MKIIYVIMSKYVKFNLQFNYIDLTLNKLFFSQEDMDVDFFSILTLLGGVGPVSYTHLTLPTIA